MNHYLLQRAADVLVITQDIDAFSQIRSSLKQGKINNRLHHVGDAIEATAYMRREGPYLFAPTPGLVLLDADLPRNSVIDLVTELKTDPKFAGIAVIAIAGTEEEIQVLDTCEHCVDGQINKPFVLRELLQTLHSIKTLSFLVVQIPVAK